MTKSLRDLILNYDDAQHEIVKVPEWGDLEIKVIGLSGAQRDSFENSLIKGIGKKAKSNTRNMRARLVALTACDPETGKKIFDPADVAQLGKKSAAALDLLFATAQKLSGISDEDVEELEKNSEDDQSAVSTSD